MFNAIVVAVDGSEVAERAVTLAARLAASNGAVLHILNVPQDETAAMVMSGVGGYVPITPLPPRESLLEAGRQVIDKAELICDKAGMSVVQKHIRPGNAAHEVVALAEEVDADLIVSGRRGLGGIASAVLGSTSHAILSSAHCACLSVR